MIDFNIFGPISGPAPTVEIAFTVVEENLDYYFNMKKEVIYCNFGCDCIWCELKPILLSELNCKIAREYFITKCKSERLHPELFL